jgi:glycosyltransferase involved in cell wall biosynthesis
MLKLSLIIPVYNEEHHIKACLDAVAAQTRMPDEVIVVDNNCTDGTVEIARTYPFVRVVKESHQGRGHARSAGFNAAYGDILGRIDADSRIAPNWTERAVTAFSKDPKLDGLTGIASTTILPVYSGIKATLLSRIYFWYVHALFNTVTMWGANMAVRRSAWNAVKAKVVLDDRQVHEDIDVSLWIAATGRYLAHDNALRITTGGQSYRDIPKTFYYGRLMSKTLQLHRQNGNLSSPSLPRLGFWSTLPGRLASFAAMAAVAIVGTLLLPLDLMMLKVVRFKGWLD